MMSLRLPLLLAFSALAGCGSTMTATSSGPVDTLYDMSLPPCERALSAIPTSELEDYTIGVLASMVMTPTEAMWFLFTDEALLISPDGNRRAPTLELSDEFDRLRDAGGDTTSVTFAKVDGEWICEDVQR